MTTPESRLAVAAAEYERAARALGHVPMPRSRPTSRVTTGEGATRVMPSTDGDDGYLMSSKEDGDSTLERIVYGLGRAYERAIQEARGFEMVDVGRVSR